MAEYVNKNAPTYKMKGSPMQRNFGIKPSPTKWAFLAPVIEAIVGAVAGGAIGEMTKDNDEEAKKKTAAIIPPKK